MGETAYSAKGQAQILSLDLHVLSTKKITYESLMLVKQKHVEPFFLHQPSWKHWQVAGNEHVATVVCSMFDNFQAALSKFHGDNGPTSRRGYGPTQKWKWIPTTWIFKFHGFQPLDFQGAIC